jgi:hypothetical protein
MDNINKKHFYVWIIQLILIMGVEFCVTWVSLEILVSNYSWGIKVVTALVPIIFNSCTGIGLYLYFVSYVLKVNMSHSAIVR